MLASEAHQADPEAWLGLDSVIAADGGASDVMSFCSTHSKNDDEIWFNFCHSSTRFFVEETCKKKSV